MSLGDDSILTRHYPWWFYLLRHTHYWWNQLWPTYMQIHLSIVYVITYIHNHIMLCGKLLWKIYNIDLYVWRKSVVNIAMALLWIFNIVFSCHVIPAIHICHVTGLGVTLCEMVWHNYLLCTVNPWLIGISKLHYSRYLTLKYTWNKETHVIWNTFHIETLCPIFTGFTVFEPIVN